MSAEETFDVLNAICTSTVPVVIHALKPVAGVIKSGAWTAVLVTADDVRTTTAKSSARWMFRAVPFMMAEKFAVVPPSC